MQKPVERAPRVAVLVNGEPREVEGALGEVLRRLLELERSLASLPSWQARIDVAGRSVRVWANTPVRPPRGEGE